MYKPIPIGEYERDASCNNGERWSDKYGICYSTSRLPDENRIDRTHDRETKRKLQLDYISKYGGIEGRNFKRMIEALLNISGLTAGDASEINKLVDKFYQSLKGQYMMAIFSPDNVGLIIGLGISNGISTPLKRG